MGTDVAITFDGTQFTVYYEGQQVVSGPSCGLGTIAQPALTIGATPAERDSSPYQGYLSGFVQRASVGSACLTAAEITDFLTNPPLTDGRCVFYTEFMDSEPANRVTGRPISLVGDATIAELSYPVTTSAEVRADAAFKPAVPNPMPWKARPAEAPARTLSPRHAMRRLAAARKIDGNADVPAFGGMRDTIISDFEKQLANVPPERRDATRTLFTRN